MYIKFLSIVLVTCLSFAACKKSSNNDLYSDKIVLEPLKVSGNKVTLSWSKLNNGSLESYHIIKVTDTLNNYNSAQSYIVVDKNTTTYTDTLPFTPYVQYYIVANIISPTTAGPISSNKETCLRTDVTFMNIIPSDVLYDKDSHLIYLYSTTGDIAVYNLQSKAVQTSIVVHGTIGYCALGAYNGKKELYVPRDDGWILIYDANTLDLIDKINCGNSPGAVAFNNGVIYATITDQYYDGEIVSYDRGSKSLISQTSTSPGSFQAKIIPSSATDFYALSRYGDLYYFDFSANGIFNAANTKSASTTGSIDPYNFEIYPDGSNLIDGSSGDIYNSNLGYVVTLPHGNIRFNCFTFDMSNRLIYTGCSNNSIQAYAMDSYQLSRSISTKGNPYKIFFDNGSIIAVSILLNTNNYYSSVSFIEQF